MPGCGGPINALVFTPDGKVDEKRPEETAFIEAELKQLHAEFSDLFRDVAVARPNHSEAGVSLNAFTNRMIGAIPTNNP